MQFKTFLGDIPIYLCTLICPCIPTCILIHMVDAGVVKCGFLAVVVPKYIHIKSMYIMLYGLYGLYTLHFRFILNVNNRYMSFIYLTLRIRIWARDIRNLSNHNIWPLWPSYIAIGFVHGWVH